MQTSFRLLLLSAFSILWLNAVGQADKKITNFIPDQEAFFEQVSLFITEQGNTDQKKDGRDFLVEFEPVWKGPNLSTEQRLRIYKTANLMLTQDMNSYNNFYHFLFSIMNFIKSHESAESFNQWQETLDLLLEDRKMKKYYDDFLVMSADLFQGQVFYKSASVTWRARAKEYEFVFDSIPKVKFKSMDLVCYSKDDSTVIYNTRGEYHPILNMFYGSSGRVNWTRGGLDPNETFAVVDDYEVKINTSGFVIDSVKFYTPYFTDPLVGRLTEKLLANVDEENASYPRFESYSNRLYIRDIVKNVDYEGGFTMKGPKLIGTGVQEAPAILTIFRNDTAFLRASSLNFTIKPDRIASLQARIKIYMKNDSIVHPGLNFKFMKDTRILSLYRPDEGVAKSPYFNSFHNVDMYIEQIVWNIDEPLMEFRRLPGSENEVSRTAFFESANYYEDKKYEMYNPMDGLHPFVQLRDVSKKYESNTFLGSDLAGYMKRPPATILRMLLQLSIDGFILYNSEDDVITVKQKVHDYVLASAKRKDYDIITVKSVTEEGEFLNGSLNLLNYDMNLIGVDRVFLSKVQQVSFKPDSGALTFQKDRYMKFGGVVNAGKIYLHGKKFEFDYQPFKIHLIEVDSLSMNVDDQSAPPEEKRPKQVKVTSVIEGITSGELSIDNPYNKSGVLKDVENYHRYPIIDVPELSYVYWDDKSIYNGAYKRDQFFFELQPFNMDSLDDYSNNGLHFEGKFVSGKIFPEFEETLVLQDDYSLGFTKEAPAEGFPMYEGRAKFDNKISMNNSGLTGAGNLSYLTSISNSKQFTFLPDSTMGLARSFDNTERKDGVQMPDAHGLSVQISYLPYQDVLHARMVKNPFLMYQNQVFLSGILSLRPEGMQGAGIIDFETAVMESKRYEFQQADYHTDHCSFALKATNQTEAFAFKTDDINAFIDLKNRKGEFKSNEGTSNVLFPVNQYMAKMNHFDWFMDENDIELFATENETEYVQETDVAVLGSNVYSLHPEQDSLNYNAPRILYDLDIYSMFCKKVNHILVADARIFPDSGNVTVRAKAKMDELLKARIMCNNITRYHTISNASVKVKARRNYTASGEYDYIDENKQRQVIYFSNITVDTIYQTVAEGQIAETDEFTLSPNFEYTGLARLKANFHFLTFEGKARIVHECAGIERNWMEFESEINPNEIYIPVTSLKAGSDSASLAAGTVLHPDSFLLYSTFLSMKRSQVSDVSLTKVDGFLFFNKGKREYQIANKDRLRDPESPGNFVGINTETCMVTGEGRLTFGQDFGGWVTVQPIGKVTHNMAKDEVRIDGSLIIDFPFSEAAIEKMAEEINNYLDFNPAEYGGDVYRKTLREFVGLEKTDLIMADLQTTGEIKKMPPEMENTTLLLTNTTFKWNPDTRSWRSSGEIGVGNIKKKQIFRNVQGYIEILEKRTGDILYVYLEIDPEHWFYFSYTRGTMQAVANNRELGEEFNAIITDLDEGKRKSKDEGKDGKGLYVYQACSRKLKTDFLKRFDR